jgi:hypothetical protein
MLASLIPNERHLNPMWKEWKCFFTANNIVETPGEENEGANQLVIFLTEIGADVYSTLSNLLVPAKPKDTSLANIVQALEKHFNPASLEIAESFHFGTRSQKPGESIGEYVVALKKLSIHCNFGEFLNRALRDRFVCGLNNVKIQNKLLTTENITFDKACQIAKSMEMAERNTQEFHPTTSASAPSEGTVNQIESKRNDEQACYRCGGNHTAKTCRFKGHRQWIFLLPCFVLYNCLSQDMYFICDENISICSKERMNLV